MPVMSGVEATRAISASGADTAVLVLTMFDDDQTVVTAVQAGARGYLLKGADQDEIARSLKAVASGEVIFGPGVAGAVLGMMTSPPSPPELFPELTTRERDILRLLTEGHRTADIASQLYLSPKTVSNCLTSIFSKLGVTSRAEAIVAAHERGMRPNGPRP
jgi:DNA-binding NarL/FixJ family response regulator